MHISIVTITQTLDKPGVDQTNLYINAILPRSEEGINQVGQQPKEEEINAHIQHRQRQMPDIQL